MDRALRRSARIDDGWNLTTERNETAPPWDGTPVLGGVVGERAVLRVRWENNHGRWRVSPLGPEVKQPTHWRPLPAPPAARSDDEHR